GARPEGEPGERPAGKFAAKPGARSFDRPGGTLHADGTRTTARRVADRGARPVAESGLAAPQLDELAKAKLAWQPTLQWCQREMKATGWMDAKVKRAVQEFSGLVQAVTAATDAGAFQEAQAKAAAFRKEDPFLAWAPLPSPLPKV
ncbi:MAG TPA: hypothetical protein VK464_17995, partial [Symbiobacteriaceae bacterium]|nr:hypothetical protein [Symbiobacteriaceae bacterium]